MYVCMDKYIYFNIYWALITFAIGFNASIFFYVVFSQLTKLILGMILKLTTNLKNFSRHQGTLSLFVQQDIRDLVQNWNVN